jgi:hypothetical protein
MEQNKKQTAVEWFFENLNSHKIQLTANELFEQAKQKEKEQIIKAHMAGFDSGYGWRDKETGNEYYEKTYDKKE